MAETTHEALVRQTATAEELLSYFQGNRAAMDAKIAAKEAQVDAFIAGAENAFTLPDRAVFDPSVIHSKTSLSPTVDPENNSQTNWQIVNMIPSVSRISGNELKKAVLHINNTLTNPPGLYEDPQFSNDKSRTLLNFVLASSEMSSDEINARISERGLVIENVGGSLQVVAAKEIPIIRPDGNGAFMKLWVRFRNVVFSGDGEPQEITTFGGNILFQLDSLSVYNF